MTSEEMASPANRSLLLVHGRDFKPGRDAYFEISMAALRAGIERDYPDMVEGFDVLQKHFAWFGDLSAEILEASGRTYDRDLDIGDRRNALSALCKIKARKRFGIRQYDCLPGKSAIPEFLADVSAPVLGTVGLAMPVIRSVAPDFAAYFNRKLNHGVQTRARLRTQICELMDRGERILLLAHGMGSAIAYDVLWELSNDEALKEQYGDNKVEVFLTLGSPLGDRNIQKRLHGAKEHAARRHPGNIISWHNVSAEDDYMCHDNTLVDDYRMMRKQRLISAVHDYHVFNLAVRYGQSNPHSSVGYFIHPRVSKIIADWLR